MRKKVILGVLNVSIIFVVFAVIYFIPSYRLVYAPQANASDIVTIYVNVSKKVLVDINPSSLTWYNLEPGNDYGAAYEKNNYENIWIENIGSVNISKIWLNNSYPSSRPFGTGNPLAYDPANFIVVANNSVNSPDSPFMYINRVEYEENDTLYIKVPNTSLTYPGIIFGRFRNGTREYFFEYVSSYANNCSNGYLYMNTSYLYAKTQTNTGDIDIRDNQITGQFVPVTLSNGGVLDGKQFDVGYVKFDTGDEYCVFVPVNCPGTGAKVFFVRWNADFLDDTGLPVQCQNLKGYLNKDPIPPGGFYKAWVHIRVPYGTAYGDLSPGTVTVYASAA